MSLIDEVIKEEVSRQDELWGAQTPITDDRWMEIATDEFRDLAWANRTRAEVANHTIDKEMIQLIAVLFRWLRARGNYSG